MTQGSRWGPDARATRQSAVWPSSLSCTAFTGSASADRSCHRTASGSVFAWPGLNGGALPDAQAATRIFESDGPSQVSVADIWPGLEIILNFRA